MNQHIFFQKKKKYERLYALYFPSIVEASLSKKYMG